MQPLRSKKKHATSHKNKKSQNFLGQKKSRKPLLTKKFRNLWRQKKKVTQPLLTKNSCKLLGQKNHATSKDKKSHASSWDINKLCNISGQEKQATSLDIKKITQPHKKSKNLSGQKKICHLMGQKNHAN